LTADAPKERSPSHVDPLAWLGTTSVAVLLLLTSFALPAAVALRSLGRLTEIREYAVRTEMLAGVQSRLQARIVDDAGGSLMANVAIVDAMRASLAEVAESGLASGREGERLAELESIVSRRNVLPPEVILEGVVLIQELHAREVAEQAALVEDLRADATREAWLAAVGFSLVVAFGAWFLRARVLSPLRGLRRLMTELGEGRFAVASTEGLHPVMVPVFENYNQLVSRLGELEGAHRERAQSLEESVRSAAFALMEKQQALARSERLAAVGETSAALAHELRNPLAGAAIALQNLRHDVSEADVAARIDAVAAEVDRAVRTLNEYLRSARHSPEAPAPVDVGELLRELVALLRYQAPAHVTIDVTLDGDLKAILPRERLRQTVTNLVLNALQALGGEHGLIVVSARRVRGALEVRVEDDGQGFPAAMIESGVRPFATGREGGTGLGLAIARRTAQDLGGSLAIYNRSPRGAGVLLTIPLPDA
jgi:signal transduction histidine kinase